MKQKRALLVIALAFLLGACSDRTENQRQLVDGRENGTPIAENDSTRQSEAAVSGSISDPPVAAEDQPGPTSAETTATVVAPTPVPEPGKELVLCMSGPPTDLYLYGDDSPAAVALRHAIYENLLAVPGYEYQAQGLEKVPSLTDGDARLMVVDVEEEEMIVDVDGRVLALREGVRVRDAAGEVVSFRGEPLEMEQLVVDFAFKPLVWSDGTPVTAADSVFSFNVAADPSTAVGKARIATTHSYEATGDRSVRWTGLPGYRDQTYFSNVWSPLPSHQLDGFSAVDLAQQASVNRQPLSSGPFVIAAWDEPDELLLEANPHYYRAAEGLPRLTRIVVRFGDDEAFLADAENSPCDVISGEALSASNLPILAQMSSPEQWQIITAPGMVYEQIVFGIEPNPVYLQDRPDWFSDSRVRQAIAQCVDRERMLDELTAGRAQLLDSYVPPDHPLAPADLIAWTYDPAAANRLLDEAGYQDYAGDGRRQDVTTGRPMTLTLGTNSESTLRLQVTQLVQEDLADCGIPVTLYDLPAGSWYGTGPEGPVFGRQFDLAELAWLGRALPNCGLYRSEAIPGPEQEGFRGWRGSNVGGWRNDDFDAACTAALTAMPDGPDYVTAQQEALRIFNAELPVLPLFTNVKVAVARSGVDNLQLEPAESSLLWNVHAWDLDEAP